MSDTKGEGNRLKGKAATVQVWFQSHVALMLVACNTLCSVSQFPGTTPPRHRKACECPRTFKHKPMWSKCGAENCEYWTLLLQLLKKYISPTTRLKII